MIDPGWLPAFFLVAALYSAVGLGGGSAYVAFLALAGLPHTLIPGTALGLNLLVTGLGFSLHRKNLPAQRGIRLVGLYGAALVGAWLGSRVALPDRVFYVLLGSVLVGAALVGMGQRARKRPRPSSRRWKWVYPAAFGCALIAAMVGIGGGIFLAPVLLISGFSARETAGITSLYIALNSLVGFAGHLQAGRVDLLLLARLMVVVLGGAGIGAFLGSRALPERRVRQLLSLLILVVGVRITWMGVRP